MVVAALPVGTAVVLVPEAGSPPTLRSSFRSYSHRRKDPICNWSARPGGGNAQPPPVLLPPWGCRKALGCRDTVVQAQVTDSTPR